MVSNRRMVTVNLDTFGDGIAVHLANRILTAFTFQQLDIHAERFKTLVETRQGKAVSAQERSLERKVLQLHEIVSLFGIALFIGRPKIEQHLGLIGPIFSIFASEPEHFGPHQNRTGLDSGSHDIRVETRNHGTAESVVLEKLAATAAQDVEVGGNIAVCRTVRSIERPESFCYSRSSFPGSSGCTNSP